MLLKDSIQSGYAGMSISFSIAMMGYVGRLSRALIETDKFMASPQRLFEYNALEHEGKHIESGTFE